MYNNVLLAYDGSLEGAVALREGAILAKGAAPRCSCSRWCRTSPGCRWRRACTAASSPMNSIVIARCWNVASTGCATWLRAGIKLAVGDPARVIGEYASEVNACLVGWGLMIRRKWTETGASGADFVFPRVPARLSPLQSKPESERKETARYRERLLHASSLSQREISYPVAMLKKSQGSKLRQRAKTG